MLHTLVPLVHNPVLCSYRVYVQGCIILAIVKFSDFQIWKSMFRKKRGLTTNYLGQPPSHRNADEGALRVFTATHLLQGFCKPVPRSCIHQYTHIMLISGIR